MIEVHKVKLVHKDYKVHRVLKVPKVLKEKMVNQLMIFGKLKKAIMKNLNKSF